jgi:hypothetical protein
MCTMCKMRTYNVQVRAHPFMQMYKSSRPRSEAEDCRRQPIHVSSNPGNVSPREHPRVHVLQLLGACTSTSRCMYFNF